MVQFTVHLDEEQYAYLGRVTRSWDVSKSEIVRRALDAYMVQHPVAGDGSKDSGSGASSKVAPVENEAHDDSVETSPGPERGDRSGTRWFERRIW